MKPSMIYVLLLLFIIATQSLFFSTTTTTAAAADDDIIKDSKGKKMSKYAPYHIGPVTPTKGSRIKLTDTMDNKKICPRNVVQDTSKDEVGGQFAFNLIGIREDKYLHTFVNLAIVSAYPEASACEKGTFWTIPDAKAKPPSNLITTGGGFDEDTTCFQFVEYPKPTNPVVPSYMLQHCPYHCGGGSDMTCYNISIYKDNGVKRLSSTGATPFEFAFYKVKSTNDSVSFP